MFELAKSLFRDPPWPPLRFPPTGFEVVGENVILEEEQLEESKRGLYYPVNIGEVFDSKYQIVGKLGFGLSSTVWLARVMM
jgi:serine/threonine-protein kinase SRPK3